MKELLLISRAVQGDRNALEQLVRLYYEKIYNYIFFRVSDRTLAEDLTQDVFVKLTKNIHSYVPTGLPGQCICCMDGVQSGLCRDAHHLLWMWQSP